ncbi:MAG: hypothetical protein QMD11_01160 [Smithella sp.]|nr:hypothetical protein [Smithella sp.]
MSRSDTNKNGSKTKIILATLITSVVMITGYLYWWNGSDENMENSVSEIQAIASNMSEKQIIDAQELAAMAAIPGKTVSGTVTERPDYVSEMEWQVLQNVARQNPDVHLTDLVNKMLFIKKKQAWIDAGENTDLRRQLAGELLEMIPQQLATEAIDAATAEEMEAELHADLR